MSKNATIKLARPSQYTDRLRAYKVHLDGALHGTIKDAETLTLSVPPGQHPIRLTVDWLSSNTLDLNCGDGEEVHLECGNALGVGDITKLSVLVKLFVLIKSFFRFIQVNLVARDSYLYVKQS